MQFLIVHILLLFLLALNQGCAGLLGLPTIDSKDVPGVVQALAIDQANFCLSFRITGGAGGMAVTPTPSVPIGGWGNGSFLVGRVNADNSKLEINEQGCKIERESLAGKP